MALKRYFSTADNTITNAFQENLTIRGTGSNMGAADVVEVFSILGQVSGASGLTSELSRALVQFPISNVITDRTAGNIPASGSVSFFLKMYNAEHTRTTPTNYTITITQVSSSWQEGYGLDMEFYEDLTRNKIGSNWIPELEPHNPKDQTPGTGAWCLGSDTPWAGGPANYPMGQ